MTTAKEKMLRGKSYNASDPQLVTERERARQYNHMRMGNGSVVASGTAVKELV